jgi:hypothetical protein
MTRPYTFGWRPLLWLRVWYDLTLARLAEWTEEKRGE